MKKLVLFSIVFLFAATASAQNITWYFPDMVSTIAWDAPVNVPEDTVYYIYLAPPGDYDARIQVNAGNESSDLTYTITFPAIWGKRVVGVLAYSAAEQAKSEITWSDMDDTVLVPEPFGYDLTTSVTNLRKQ